MNAAGRFFQPVQPAHLATGKPSWPAFLERPQSFRNVIGFHQLLLNLVEPRDRGGRTLLCRDARIQQGLSDSERRLGGDGFGDRERAG